MPPSVRLAAAEAPPALWRLAGGTALAAAGWLGAGALLLPGAGSRSAEALLFLASFGGLLLGLALAVGLLHHRSLAALLGPAGFRIAPFAWGAAACLALAAISAAASLTVAPALRQPSLAAWARHLPLALPLIALQATAEELFFRGYLLQGLAARFRSPLAWWIAPSLLFGALHWNPADQGALAPLSVASATLAGLLLADITVRTGGLSAAIGIHLANNLATLLLLAPPSNLDGLALFVFVPAPGALRALALIDLATQLAAWAAWLAIRRRLAQSGASM